MVAARNGWRRDLALNPLRLIAVGLLAAVLTGTGSMLLGYPFLTSHAAHVMLPVIGECTCRARRSSTSACFRRCSDRRC
jgi:multicomponent K+:H+ antiporter subunit A